MDCLGTQPRPSYSGPWFTSLATALSLLPRLLLLQTAGSVARCQSLLVLTALSQASFPAPPVAPGNPTPNNQSVQAGVKSRRE